MESLTIGNIIAYVDGIKPNTRTPEEKKQWLNDIDAMIKEDIIDTHEDFESVEFYGYNEETSDSHTLIVPAHYGRDLYSFYLMMKIDFVNAEYTKYNTNAALFQSAYDGFATYYHNHHMPLQKNSINFGKRGEQSYGNPLSND